MKRRHAHPGYIRSVIALILLDMAVLLAVMGAVVMVRHWLGGAFAPGFYLPLAWSAGLFAGIGLLAGCYPECVTTPPEELKRLTWALSVYFLALALLFFLSHEAALYSRSIFLAGWALSLVLLPLVRTGVRLLFPDLFGWRPPCVVIGQEALVLSVVPRLQGSMDIRAVFTENDGPGVPLQKLATIAASTPRCQALLLASREGDWPPGETMLRLSFFFRHVLLYSAQTAQLSTWTRGVSLGEFTFLTCQFKLLDPWRMRFKRATDILFCLTFGLAILPLLCLLAVVIRLDSPGPAFFVQRRLGRYGRPFSILKFRTMFVDADVRLRRILERDGELARQWKEKQKIARDPRITRVGRWLRRTSLDELPQCINVLRGEMSLVGPRPIVEAEIAKYGRHYAMFTRVRPGLTGLWQVSGRNKMPYARRVALDMSYIRNWSIYTDIWILARTAREVFRLTGQ